MDTTINEDVIFVNTEIVEPPKEFEEWESPGQMIAAHLAVKESALKKLAKLGLTEDEARAVIGF